MIRWAERLTPFAAALLLAGCSFVAGIFSGEEKPYSEYFLVSFLPGTPTPSESGLEALDGAVREAERSRPREIVIDGAMIEGGAEPPLEKERTDAVFAAFAKARIDTRLIRIELRPTTEQGYAERKESLIVQLAYGPPPPG